MKKVIKLTLVATFAFGLLLGAGSLSHADKSASGTVVATSSSGPGTPGS